MPDENASCHWVDPRTGEQCSFRLEHAVDYALSVDGSTTTPIELRLAVGASFCREPPIGPSNATSAPPLLREPSTPRNATSIEQASSIVSLFAPEETSRIAPTRSAEPRSGPPSRLTYTRSMEFDPQHKPNFNSANAHHHGTTVPIAPGTISPSNTSPMEVRIVETLLNQPDLLARFLQVITPANARQSSTLVPSVKPTRRTSKYAFVPTTVQVSVHNSIPLLSTEGSLSGFTTSSLAYSGSRPFTLPPPGFINE
ncbi:hypothetical protein PHMEG_00030601 [Phytophthora megakarya]|uniref:Uncharacterized protein n=1 Tax=Phytophthora megakarya TaxID=4795 RepID=A0A225V0P3_9STRA|nr:hypothetical protein PHMEG_00030601 [Phytophthora megakarya]